MVPYRPARADQVFVASLLGDLALMHDENPVGVYYGAEAMSHRYQVWPVAMRSKVALMAASVEGSSDAVASSRMSSAGSRRTARAIARRWRWPPGKSAAAYPRERTVSGRECDDEVVNLGVFRRP